MYNQKTNGSQLPFYFADICPKLFLLQLPEFFIQSIHNVKGFSKEAFEEVHASGKQVTSVRINPFKSVDPGLLLSTASPVPWSSQGYYLAERPSFTLDPFFHAGAYYVQEASSMFVEEALRQSVDCTQALKVLDLCAAPGGKSTLLQSIITADSLLVSNEVIKTRVTVLSENISKWGASNVIVTNNDANHFRRLPEFFDVIVVDAPCSGSGLFRKDPEAVSEWTMQNVQLCSQRQQRILADVLPSLKENGVLIYSTCSYSIEEDEAIAGWLTGELGLDSVQLKVDESWGIVESQSDTGAYGYRFYPDKLAGEGFFIAVFRKKDVRTADTGSERKKLRPKAGAEKLSAKEIKIVEPFIKNSSQYVFIRQQEEVLAIPQCIETSLWAIQQSLYIKKAGVTLGTIIRDGLLPHPELAVSTIINTAVSTVNTDKETALQYLRRQDISIDTALKGWVLLCYERIPLGWIKILPGRINNYYPKEWRILNK